ncbi:hypothetical protein BC939DRAFT_500587 [Gamsiella multidivaricata]|uniref:uncharacterized protein n=1 Tax=Gamsiella multidivaricata TaxID=101098 RepID=UPI00221F1279|nr:uncharacterized protein BC939DRAFT_500587 [Gamsiella multidivaricata]KAI7828806.1 hypothetical protein BC939DRAFT_500587 [Gamsiella multidivaricata]
MTTQAVDDFEYEALPENASLSASLLAGAFAGIAEHAIMYPVDSIKGQDQRRLSGINGGRSLEETAWMTF